MRIWNTSISFIEWQHNTCQHCGPIDQFLPWSCCNDLLEKDDQCFVCLVVGDHIDNIVVIPTNSHGTVCVSEEGMPTRVFFPSLVLMAMCNLQFDWHE